MILFLCSGDIILAIYIECVMRQFEVVFQADVFNNFTQAGIVKFCEFSVSDINQVVVLKCGKGFLELGQIFTELMSDY